MTRLLDTIDSPAAVKDLSLEECARLAEEIREEIKRVISENGGHLATNLGIVEITIVLHRLFDFAEDRLIFDVGHQCYTHKLLTGRREAFPTIRKAGGLSGYPNRKESPYDPFNAGHAGTSISAGLGIACGDGIKGRKRKIVVVIGDGSIPTGLSFEGLNQLGHLQRDMIIVLNDNEMSISPTVGALAHHLTRIRTGAFYNEYKKKIMNIVRKLPLGRKVNELAEHISSHIIGGFFPGQFFKELGIRYFGPIDGHSFPELERVLSNCKRLSGPIIVHAVTQKGHGYLPARNDPEYYHGATPFNITDGSSKEKPPRKTYSEVFAAALTRLASRRTNVVAITAAMSVGTGLTVFREKFPDRFFDVGICEQHAVTFGSGLSDAGLKPVVAIYSTFLQRSLDQLFHDVSMQEDIDILFAIDRAGLVGSDGFSHHGLLDIGMLRPLPHFILMAPKDGAELEEMLAFAVEHKGMFAVRYPRELVPDRDAETPSPPIEMGKGEVLLRGSRVVLFAYGAAVSRCLGAAGILADEGMCPTVVNARFAKPLDIDLLRELARDHEALVTVEDHMQAGGFGSAVVEGCIMEGISFSRVRIKGVPDVHIAHASREEQLRQAGLDEESIAAAVRSLWREA